eukprot:2362725-Lingulodinium_polyedra.AAC.1
MARSNRCVAADAARKPHTNAIHARTDFSVRAWSAIACDSRAAAAAKRRFVRVTAQLSVRAAQWR